METLGSDFNFFRNPKFADLRRTVDGYLKHLKSTERATGTRSDAITTLQEAGLWEQGTLGCHNAGALQNTILWYLAKFFALRGGDEIKKFQPEDLLFHCEEDEKMRVTYFQQKTKNNQGGLYNPGLTTTPKTHIEDPEDRRSLTKLFALYINKLDPTTVNTGVFWFKPKKEFNAQDNVWYTTSPVGKNLLGTFVKRLMNRAGYTEGRFTNHSLRISAINSLRSAGKISNFQRSKFKTLF